MLKTLLATMMIVFSPIAMASQMSMGGLLNFVVYLVVVGLIFWCIWWFLGYVGVPEPFNKVIRVILGLFALIIVVNLLLGLVGTPFIRW